MENSSHDRLGYRLRLCLLAASGLIMSLAFWVLISLALNPKLSIVFDVKRARYGGPLTWPARIFNLRGLSVDGTAYLFTALMFVLALCYVSAVYLVRKEKRRSPAFIICGFFVLFALLFIFIPPFETQDIYSYIFYGRAMSVYHANPYLLAPAARSTDVFYSLVGWRQIESAYGPLFNMLSFVITRAAGNSLTGNVLGFKALAALSYAGCLPLTYALARRVSPGRENFALAVTAWCPLLVMHVFGGGHNDTLMALLVLAGFLLYKKDHAYWGLVFVLLACMIKIVAVFALAPYLVYYLRDSRGKLMPRLAGAAGAVVIVPVLFYLPFYEGLKTFDATREVSGMYSFSSVPRLIAYEAQRVLVHLGFAARRADSLSKSVIQLIFLLIFVALTLYLLTRVRDFRSMLTVSAAITLLWFLTSTYILPWYLVMGIMIAAVTGWNAVTGGYIAASCIFLLYRIPGTHIANVPGTGRVGTNLYLSLPLLLLLICLLVLGFRDALRNRSADRTDVSMGREVSDEQ